MARLIIEDAVLFLLAFYLLSSLIFGVGLFNSYLPNQRYNSTTSSFEAYTPTTTSIFGDTYEMNSTLAKYENSTALADPGAMLNPLGVVELVRTYIALFVDIISSTMLYSILKMFMGAALAHVITFILNIMVFLVAVRVITGRTRFE